MAISIICQQKDPTPWVKALKNCDPLLDVRVWPDDGNRAEIQFALCWNHPHGIFTQYPQLKTISSMGAGVDHLLLDKSIPEKIAIVRLFDKKLVNSMFDYINVAIDNFRLNIWRYQLQKNAQVWQQHLPIEKSSLPIGVLGLGQLGSKISQQLSANGFVVNGWSNSQKSLDGINCFTGMEQLPDFMASSRILINLLPLTSQTAGLLNFQRLQELQPGGLLINVARGAHLNETDLLLLLDQNQLAFACLDVFSQEPLPAEHAFWQHPKIQLTPHISSLTKPESVAPQIIENYYRSSRAETLLNQVNRQKGY